VLTSIVLPAIRIIPLLPLGLGLVYDLGFSVPLVLCYSLLVARVDSVLVGEAVKDSEDERTPAQKLLCYPVLAYCPFSPGIHVGIKARCVHSPPRRPLRARKAAEVRRE